MAKKIGIIGGGVVGSAIKDFFNSPDFAVKIYDKYKPIDPLDEVLTSDYIFIGVPTPYNHGFDLAEMNDAFNNLKAVKDKIVIIKSTVLPGTTDNYQKQYPNLKILFNPEFLTEATAVEDFRKPDKQIVGYTAQSQGVAEQVLNLLPPAPLQKIMPAREAEMVKYAVNSFYALKVIFANQLYDLCQKIGFDYDLVRQGFAADKRIFDSHFEIFHKGYRGYGGKCLRKDVDSLIDFGERNNFSLELLKTAKEINDKLREGNGRKEVT